MKELEKGFVLDGVAVGKQSNDETGRSQPSPNIGIPQYNALRDKHCKNYFTTRSLPKFVQPTKSLTSVEDAEHSASMMGNVFDKFVRNSLAKQYLKERESIGAGELLTVH